jgi:hypothetical protein
VDDPKEVQWLVEVFLEYQEALDRVRAAQGDRRFLKEGLDIDKKRRARLFDSASSIETL